MSLREFEKTCFKNISSKEYLSTKHVTKSTHEAIESKRRILRDSKM